MHFSSAQGAVRPWSWCLVLALSACGGSEERGPSAVATLEPAAPNEPSPAPSTSRPSTANPGTAPMLGSSGAAAAGDAEGMDPGNIGGIGAAGGAPGSSNGSSGMGGAGAGGMAGATASTGGSGGQASDCSVPPPASPLLGWASVAGRGVSTTTGGGDASPVTATSLEELRTAVAGSAAAVVFVQGDLEPGDIAIGSNKTIVGLCGAVVRGHLELRESVNVIVRNLTIVGYGEGDCSLDPDFDPEEGCSSGVDAVSVQNDSHHIWFDHCAVRDGTDGNLDITNGADFVTVSWTKFSYTPRRDDVGGDSTGAAGHRFSNLVGGTDSPDDFDDANALNVTWHHNWWAENVVERQPRIRFGQNHLFNNYYNSLTTNYCVRAGIQAAILLEGNVFDGVDDPHEFNDADDQLTANIIARPSNIYIGTTSDQATGGGGPAFELPPYDYALDEASGVAAAVVSGAGPR